MATNQGVFFGQLVIGPAGSGKSTYCFQLQEMAETLRRNIIVVNLDPAAEKFRYRCDIDIRDLVTLDDVMEELQLGPNGGLIQSLEFLIENIDWLEEQLGELAQDDYVLFDCPGQMELYTHLDIMRKLTRKLQGLGFSLCSMYMLDSTFTQDHSKFVSGCLMALSAMTSLSLPHLTVLTKCDLIPDKELLQKYLDFSEEMEFFPLENDAFQDEEQNEKDAAPARIVSKFEQKYRKLHTSMRELLDKFSLVAMRPLDVSDEESVRDLLFEADELIQYGEQLEPDERNYQSTEDALLQQYASMMENNDN